LTQTEDVLKEIEKVTPVKELKVDGGLTRSQFLMQFQSNLSGLNIIKTDTTEITATGSAYIAGIASDFWKLDQLAAMSSIEKEFYPDKASENAGSGYFSWKQAVARSFGWEN
jgi:glycerol kinase